eukprot:scaffold42655_cov51-Phaeocystis_antarctica.AAC.1
MPSAQCPMPTAHCPLPNAHCALPTAHCPLPTAHCPLPTAQCPLPTAQCNTCECCPGHRHARSRRGAAPRCRDQHELSHGRGELYDR